MFLNYMSDAIGLGEKPLLKEAQTTFEMVFSIPRAEIVRFSNNPKLASPFCLGKRIDTGDALPTPVKTIWNPL